jgi:hypothetical protein
VAGAVVVESDGRLFVVGPSPTRPRGYPVLDQRGAPSEEESVSERLPASLLEAIRSLPPGTVVTAATQALATALSARLGNSIRIADLGELRTARAAVPAPEPAEERRFLLTVGHSALERALRTPEEVLITLTREEERVERAVGREARAAESFLVVPGSSLAEYSRKWTGVRASLDGHHEMLADLVRQHARSVVPNLSAVVGERAAARLVSEAGGVSALARMRAGRIQLLGTRRRPSPERGPRYGILYRADGMSEVPPGRRGAYARSLGAIAAIAVRADATTHASISRSLVARRDRRIAQLRGRRG